MPTIFREARDPVLTNRINRTEQFVKYNCGMILNPPLGIRIPSDELGSVIMGLEELVGVTDAVHGTYFLAVELSH